MPPKQKIPHKCTVCGKTYTAGTPWKDIEHHYLGSSECRKSIATCGYCNKMFLNTIRLAQHAQYSTDCTSALKRSNEIKFHATAFDATKVPRENEPGGYAYRSYQDREMTVNVNTVDRNLSINPSHIPNLATQHNKEVNMNIIAGKYQDENTCVMMKNMKRRRPLPDEDLIFRKMAHVVGQQSMGRDNVAKGSTSRDAESEDNEWEDDMDEADYACDEVAENDPTAGSKISESNDPIDYSQSPYDRQIKDYNETESTTSEQSLTNAVPHSQYLRRLQEKMRLNISLYPCEDEFAAGLKLEAILRKCGASNYVYDDIMNWARENKHNIPDRTKLFTRKRLYERMQKTTYKGYETDMLPVQTMLFLPSNRKVGITRFKFLSQIFSILECPHVSPDGLRNTVFKNSEEYGIPGNPFHIPSLVADESLRYNGEFDDIESSFWYWRTFVDLKLSIHEDILVPIIIFLDGTQLGGLSSHSLEPFMFTLGILRRSVRNDPKAWRTLGYVENIMKIIGSSGLSPAKKLEDYHFILNFIMEELKEVCSSTDGYSWDFTDEDGTVHRRKLHFRIMFIIGDTKGADSWVGRLGSHWNTVCLSRDCDIKTVVSDNPEHQCCMFKFDELDQKSDSELQQLSMRKIKNNAFRSRKVNIFGSNPYGICVATPPESLHVILLGLVVRLYGFLMNQFTTEQSDLFRREVIETANTDKSQSARTKDNFPEYQKFLSGNLDQGHLSGKQKYARIFIIYMALIRSSTISGLFGRKGKVQKRKRSNKSRKESSDEKLYKDLAKSQGISVKALKKILLDANTVEETDDNIRKDEEETKNDEKDLEHSSTPTHLDDMDNLHERSTPTHLDDMDNLHEQDSDNEEEYDGKKTVLDSEEVRLPDPKTLVFDLKTLNDIIQIIESVLGIFKWITKPDGHPKNLFIGGSKSPVALTLKKFMLKYAELAPRLEGMGLKLYKFHVFKHWYFYIIMFASPLNSDGARVESGHIENVKQLGSRTQKRTSTVNWQCAQRFYEKTLFERNLIECRLYWRRNEKYLEDQSSSEDENLEQDDLVTCHGPYFRIVFDYTHDGERCSYNMFWLDKNSKRRKDIDQLKAFHTDIINSFVDKTMNFNNGIPGKRIKIIDGCSSFKRDDLHVRAIPSYRHGSAWNDYVSVEWENEENTPAKVMMLVDFDTAVYDDIPGFVETEHNGQTHNPKQKTDLYAIIHSAVDTNNLPPENIYCRMASHLAMEQTFREVAVSQIRSLVFCIPDKLRVHGNGHGELARSQFAESIIMIEKPQRWSEMFMKYVDADEEEEDDIGDNDFRWEEIE